MKKNKILRLRLNEDIAKKLAFVAHSEGVSLQNLIVLMARQKIQYFERVKGNIKQNDLVGVDLAEFESDEE
ncbi:MAG: hypothetical protein IJ400_04910 [Clostridia bacterium]|nr:hypothetical protein [Clostridia bacterium]